MPMFFFQFEVRPKQTHPERDRYAGAMVNCRILRDTQSQAEAVAHGWIRDEDWRITGVEEAKLMTREMQAEHPDGMQYFEQAEIDSEFSSVILGQSEHQMTKMSAENKGYSGGEERVSVYAHWLNQPGR